MKMFVMAISMSATLVVSAADKYEKNKTSLTSELMDVSKSVEQCLMPLPTAMPKSVNGSLNMYHTFIKVGGQSYGMPMTLDGGYLGGAAVIHSPDPFYQSVYYASSAYCSPVFKPKKLSNEEFERRFNCIAEKLSTTDSRGVVRGLKYSDSWVRKNNFDQNRWIPIFDYHFLENNCHSAVRLIMDCAEGEMSLRVNNQVGSYYDRDRKIDVLHIGLSASQNSGYDSLYVLIENLKDSVFAVKNENGVFENEDKISEQLDEIFRAAEKMGQACGNTRDSATRIVGKQFNKLSNKLKNLSTHTDEYVDAALEDFKNGISICAYTYVKKIEESTYWGACEKARRECI